MHKCKKAVFPKFLGARNAKTMGQIQKCLGVQCDRHPLSACKIWWRLVDARWQETKRVCMYIVTFHKVGVHVWGAAICRSVSVGFSVFLEDKIRFSVICTDLKWIDGWRHNFCWDRQQFLKIFNTLLDRKVCVQDFAHLEATYDAQGALSSLLLQCWDVGLSMQCVSPAAWKTVKLALSNCNTSVPANNNNKAESHLAWLWGQFCWNVQPCTCTWLPACCFAMRTSLHGTRRCCR